MPSTVPLPIHDAGNTFIGALSQSTESGLFSKKEKKILIGLCCTAFVLPIFLSLFLLKKQQKIATLSADPGDLALLTPASVSSGNDEVAMAEIFLNKANENITDPTTASQYLSQADSLLSLTSQVGEKIDSLRQQIAKAMGVEKNTTTSPQRIAAPAGPSSSISGETTSNATSQTVLMRSGEKELFVAHPNLEEGTQIYLTIANNRNNEVLYVAKRETGKGFTLASITPLRQDLSVTWYEIQSQ